MSSGRTHSLVTSIASGTLIGSMIALDYSIFDSSLVGLGCMSGILLTPDLDVDNGNISDSIIRNDWGHIPQYLWRLYWTPYAKILKHRSFWSHFPLVSTAIRVIYISLIPILFMYLFGFEFELNRYWIEWFIGLCVSDFLHYLFDLF